MELKIVSLGYVVSGIRLEKDGKRYVMKSVISVKDGEIECTPSKDVMQKAYPQYNY